VACGSTTCCLPRQTCRLCVMGPGVFHGRHEPDRRSPHVLYLTSESDGTNFFDFFQFSACGFVWWPVDSASPAALRRWRGRVGRGGNAGLAWDIGRICWAGAPGSYGAPVWYLSLGLFDIAGI
jgi:hypothetical protein